MWYPIWYDGVAASFSYGLLGSRFIQAVHGYISNHIASTVITNGVLFTVMVHVVHKLRMVHIIHTVHMVHMHGTPQGWPCIMSCWTALDPWTFHIMKSVYGNIKGINKTNLRILFFVEFKVVLYNCFFQPRTHAMPVREDPFLSQQRAHHKGELQASSHGRCMKGWWFRLMIIRKNNTVS